jgi:hypothetical protein
MSDEPNDNAEFAKLPTGGAADEAIRAAERWLVKQGWRYTPADVGARAKQILEAMYADTADEAKSPEAS